MAIDGGMLGANDCPWTGQFLSAIPDYDLNDADAQATIAALHTRVQELAGNLGMSGRRPRNAAKRRGVDWSKSRQSGLIGDPVNVALLDGAKEQEIIGRKQIADLQVWRTGPMKTEANGANYAKKPNPNSPTHGGV